MRSRAIAKAPAKRLRPWWALSVAGVLSSSGSSADCLKVLSAAERAAWATATDAAVDFREEPTSDARFRTGRGEERDRDTKSYGSLIGCLIGYRHVKGQFPEVLPEFGHVARLHAACSLEAG